MILSRDFATTSNPLLDVNWISAYSEMKTLGENASKDDVWMK